MEIRKNENEEMKTYKKRIKMKSEVQLKANTNFHK